MNSNAKKKTAKKPIKKALKKPIKNTLKKIIKNATTKIFEKKHDKKKHTNKKFSKTKTNVKHKNKMKHTINNKNISKKRSSSGKNTSSKKNTTKNTVQKSKVHGHKPKILHKLYSKKFCPKCGNPITDDRLLCKNCQVIDFDFKDINILLCNNCKSYNYKNKWHKFHDLNDVVKISVSSSVRHDVKYMPLDENDAEEILSYKAGVHKGFTANVSIGKERYELPATVDVTLCPKCSKHGTKYFEGILQIRNGTADIHKFIKTDAEKRKSKGIYINKTEDIDGSGSDIDYYYTDKRYLNVIADKLRDHFGATIKHNAQLFSIDWSTSKNIYRLNVLVEFPNYHKNDVLKIGKQLFKIVSIDEKIHVTNIATGNKTLLPHKESYDVLKPVEVMLIKRYPEYEILDPNTYYQARLMNPDDKLQINQKLRVVIDGGEAWII